MVKGHKKSFRGPRAAPAPHFGHPWLNACFIPACLCGPGGGHPGGGQHHRPGDVSAPPAGVALHPVLHVQTLQQEAEEEEEEERPQPPRAPLLLILIAASAPMCLNRDDSTGLNNTRRWKLLEELWKQTFILFYIFFFSLKAVEPSAGHLHK